MQPNLSSSDIFIVRQELRREVSRGVSDRISQNLSNFSTSLPNLNVHSVVNLEKDFSQPWTTDDLKEAEKFYTFHRLNFDDIKDISTPNSRGRSAPLPRGSSLEISEVENDATQLFRSNGGSNQASFYQRDLSRQIDSGRIEFENITGRLSPQNFNQELAVDNANVNSQVSSPNPRVLFAPLPRRLNLSGDPLANNTIFNRSPSPTSSQEQSFFYRSPTPHPLSRDHSSLIEVSNRNSSRDS